MKKYRGKNEKKARTERNTVKEKNTRDDTTRTI